MVFKAWKFFLICLCLVFLICDWTLLSSNMGAVADKSNIWLPVALVAGTTLAFRAFIPGSPPMGLRIFFSLAAIGLCLRYLFWRVTSTLVLDWYNGAFSLILLGMESLAIFNVVVAIYQTLNPTDRTPEADRLSVQVRSGAYCPSVDIFVPTYNEPPTILRRTLVGCKAMRYPKKTIWVLDDGRRSEIAELAASLGCRYLTRKDSAHAKAGNLNNGLKHATGEIVVVFDADFVPLNHFLERTVGFFQDPEVALLVTPQNFYNSDPPQLNLGGILPSEQTMFYSVVQPGRDRSNSIVCTGTSTLIRRTHLDKIGGMPIGTIVEDWVSGMLLQSQGFKTLYLNELLSIGAAPENFSAYIVQRVRWAEGTLKTLFSPYNPLLLPGLSFSQRLNHASGMLYWFDQAGQSLSYFAPILFLLFGMQPMHAQLPDLISYWLPTYIAGLITLSWVTGSRTVFVSFTYNALQCFHLLPVLVSTLLFPGRKVAFKVTPKGITEKPAKLDLRLMAPIICLLALNSVSALSSLASVLSADMISLHYGQVRVTNILWTEFNTVILAISLLSGVDALEGAPRVQCGRSCTLRFGNHSEVEAWLEDISEEHARLTLKAPPLEDQEASLVLMDEKLILPISLHRVGEIWEAQFRELDALQLNHLVEFIYTRPAHWPRPRIANELQAMQALFAGLFHLHPLRRIR